MSENTKRAVEMLRIAALYIEENNLGEALIRYDEADCDGYCVADDCREAAESLEIEAAKGASKTRRRR